jgi:hypothetical protein
MPWMPQNAIVLAVAAAVATGCAEHLGVQQQQSAGWDTGYLFWPPPQSTSVWTADPAPAPTSPSFGRVAARIADTLEQAGYAEQRVVPVGAGYEHGFAVTTRLERIRDDGTSESLPERWSARFPEAASLLWLAGARQPRFPRAGRYRVLLLAFTDLPLEGLGSRPPVWNETTVMAGPGLAAADFPLGRRLPRGARIVVYVYEYRSGSPEGEGDFVVAGDSALPAAAQVRGAGLSALGGPS